MSVGQTYFIDVDGTLVPHLGMLELNAIAAGNSHTEVLLPGVVELWSRFTAEDVIIITTARIESHRAMTEKLFRENGLRYDKLIMNLPCGPRIVINDTPDTFFKKAIGVNVMRNAGFVFAGNCANETP
jgi:hypothetical protein